MGYNQYQLRGLIRRSYMTVELTLDRDCFQVLSSDSRVTILKALDSKPMTITEISSSLDLAKSTVHEHLSAMLNTGLIGKYENGNKWVYYKLTAKAKNILHPHDRTRILILLSSSIVTFTLGASGVYRFAKGYVFQSGGGAIYHDPMQLILGEIFLAITFILWYFAFRLWKRTKHSNQN